MTTLPDPALLYLDPDRRTPAYALVERFAITPKAGPQLCGELYRPTKGRRTGRRIVVRPRMGGPVLYDTDEAHDLGNAIAHLDGWLADREKAAGATP